MKKILALCFCFVLLAVACGDDDRAADVTGSPSALPSVEPSPEPTDEASPEAAEDPSPSPATASGENAPIEVTSPDGGAEVKSRFVLAGEANVFEANVRYRVRTDGGRVLVDDFTTATCGSGCRGDFRTKVRLEVGRRTDAVLEVFEESAEDGSELHKVEVALVLLP